MEKKEKRKHKKKDKARRDTVGKENSQQRDKTGEGEADRGSLAPLKVLKGLPSSLSSPGKSPFGSSLDKMSQVSPLRNSTPVTEMTKHPLLCRQRCFSTHLSVSSFAVQA